MRTVAVLFADIEDCTHWCERLPAREMNRVVERYFSRFLDIVHEAGGEVTEILGDGLVAMFEGPTRGENARRALDAATRIRQATAVLNIEERARHRPIVVNMAMTAGRALVGLTRLRGRTGERSVYSATGPITNVAARLCALASGGQILVDAAVVRGGPGTWPFRRVGRRILRNVSGAVEVFEVLRT